MELLANIKESIGNDGYRMRVMRDRLNLLAAAEAHVLWKTRLGHHVQGNIRESLESAPVGQDGICQLGNWINGSVLESFCELDEFRQLKEAHQQFHQFGELIIEKLKAGNRSGAGAIFNNEYSQSLRRIIQSLTEINKHL
jgi:hypothetical protein